MFAVIDEDGVHAREVKKNPFGHRFAPEWLEQVTLGGNPDEVIGQIRAFTDAGVNLVDLKFVPPTLDGTLRQMRLVAAEVMPGFANG